MITITGRYRFTTLLFLTIIGASATFKGYPAPPAVNGAALYRQHCARCHGTDGTKGMLGARNLQKSLLPDAVILQQVQNGKGFMPSFRKKITGDSLNELLTYVKSLRKNN